MEPAKQSIAVFLGPIGEVGDEVLDLLAGGIAQGLHATEIGRIGLDQGGIELMLANQLVEAITDRPASAVPVAIGGLRRLLGLWTRSGLTSEGTDLLDRADADAIGLAQGAIDGSRFGHAHLGAVDK
jgi:hypothetical protein